MEMRATRSFLLNLPDDGPQGLIPSASRQSLRPQAFDTDASRNPQGDGGRHATQSLYLHASEARAQPKAKRAIEEFFQVGERLRAIHREVQRELNQAAHVK